MQPKGKIELSYKFTAKALPPELYIAYEGEYSVAVNGKSVRKTNKFWKDICFTVAKIDGKIGENIVTLSKDFAECDDIENVYILGKFGVNEQNDIVELPTSIKVSEVDKVLPYYAGEVCFDVGIYEKINLRHTRLPREISSKLITDDGDKYICYYPYTSSIVPKTSVTLSVILGTQNLFTEKERQ